MTEPFYASLADRVTREPESWKQYGACFGMDPNVWYPERGQDVKPAKAVCRRCPVVKACLAYALATHETLGIWGGRTERERRRLRMGRSLEVRCVYADEPSHPQPGVVKAGKASQRTCNRQRCKDRWAHEQGDHVAHPKPACFLCAASRAVTPAGPVREYVLVGQSAFELGELVAAGGLPRSVRRPRHDRAVGEQLGWAI